jgi:acetyl-CoA carboxylase carboxyltransferase component
VTTASAAWAPLRPAERLARLCDPGTLNLLTPERQDGVSVIAGHGLLEGRPVFCYGQDAFRSGGAVGTREAEIIVAAVRQARAVGAPVVAFLESAGARLQEGAASLGGFGRIFFETVHSTGRAPQVSVITGASAGGGCYSPALTDFIVMTRRAAMFLTGPKVVHEAVGEVIEAEALGGPEVHERNGVCHFVTDDDLEAVATVRRLLGLLADTPDGNGNGDGEGDAPDPGRWVPQSSRKVYDVRDVARDLLDDGQLLEVARRWAPNLVVGFGRLHGRTVGVVANQPRHLAGVIDVAASEKGARFVRTCERFGTPLAVLVDTPGFMPGSEQEWAGIIRHGAELVRAFAAATVPRVTVVLRKAYGGAYITMNSKDLGATRALAWPGAEIGVMGSVSAVRIIHRRQLAAAADPAAETRRLADAYALDHIAADRALALGLIDGVVTPAHTRAALAAALR